MNRATPDPSAARVIRRVFSHLADAVMQQLLSGQHRGQPTLDQQVPAMKGT